MQRLLYYISCLIFVCSTAVSCRVAAHAGADGAVVSRVGILIDDEPVQDAVLYQTLLQRPYRRTLGFLPIAAWIWMPDTTTVWHRMRNRLGTEPAVYDHYLTSRTDSALRIVMKQRGYLDARVTHRVAVRRGKARVTYDIRSGRQRYFSSLRYVADDVEMLRIVEEDTTARLLSVGQYMEQMAMEGERQRITALLRDRGYRDFSKDQVSYLADTTVGSAEVDLTCVISGLRQPWHIRTVLWHGDRSDLRRVVLDRCCFVQPGMLYSETAVRQTMSALSRLHFLRFAHVRMEPVPGQDHLLDCIIELEPQRAHSIQLELDGTNTAGDFGAAAGITYQHRNALHGSETFTTHLKGSYEALSGNLEKVLNDHYQELSAQFSLDFPQFLFPFLRDDLRRRSRATTLIQAGYSSQSRPEFSRNTVQGGIAYKWNSPSGRARHLLDVVNLSYVQLPEQSETFRELIHNMGPLIYSSYTSHFIMAMDYNLYMGNNPRTTGRELATMRDLWSLRINPEIAGNVLQLMSHTLGAAREGDGLRRYSFFGQPFEQYVRFDIDWSFSHYLTDRSRLALHGAGGFARPYGNSDVMPFEKRYYSGGANSVRGWSVRELGPGTYASHDSRYNYFNQCGDIRLDASVELRTRLFWKLESALFVDAGNVWTIKEYANQRGGQFTSGFYRQIATSWGVGLRMLSDLVVLRLDWGFKAFDPSSDADESWALPHPLRRNHNTIHFAVGYPF